MNCDSIELKKYYKDYKIGDIVCTKIIIDNKATKRFITVNKIGDIITGTVIDYCFPRKMIAESFSCDMCNFDLCNSCNQAYCPKFHLLVRKNHPMGVGIYVYCDGIKCNNPIPGTVINVSKRSIMKS